MPRRSMDGSGKPFEFRPGIGGFPPLGGIFRSGDPATIPPNKHHLVVNCRITPAGMKTRPGLSLLHSTGVSECVVALTGDEEELSALLLYPGAVEGPGLTPPLNAMTFRAIWPRGGDLTYSEYAAVGFGSPSKTPGALSKVIEPLALASVHTVVQPTIQLDFYYGCTAMLPNLLAEPTDPPDPLTCPPFLLNGRVHAFMVMPKPDAEDQWGPAIALVAMDLPGRTRELASDAQRGTGTAGLVGDPATLFPFDDPLGTSQVVFYPQNPFANEAINCVMDVLVWSDRRDDPTPGQEANVGVRELLFMLVLGTAGTVAVVRWDGVAETLIETIFGLDLSALPPLIGAQAHGPFVVASTGGALGDYAGYLSEGGAWIELPKGLVYSFGVLGDPEPFPGEVQITVDHWGAYKETSSGRGVIAFQAVIPVVYGGVWVTGRGIWAFEMAKDGSAWNVPVATFASPGHDNFGVPSTSYGVRPKQYLPVEILNEKLVASAYYEYETDARHEVHKHPYTGVGPVTGLPVQSVFDATADVFNAIDGVSTGPRWDFWIKAVAGRLYAGGSLDAYDVTTSDTDPIFIGPTEAATRGCLGSAPSAEVAEGFGASGEA